MASVRKAVDAGITLLDLAPSYGDGEACAISGGPYIGHAETNDGTDMTVPVDLYVPGCPPHPLTILDVLLALLGRIP